VGCPSASNSTAGTHDIVIADVDGDGKPDIVMRGETASVVSVYLQVNKTPGRCSTSSQGSAATAWMSPT